MLPLVARTSFFKGGGLSVPKAGDETTIHILVPRYSDVGRGSRVVEVSAMIVS